MNTPTPIPVIRGDWNGFAVYLEAPGQTEPGEFVGLFNTLTGAARAAAATEAAMADLAAVFREAA